jgi:hypothetical protein
MQHSDSKFDTSHHGTILPTPTSSKSDPRKRSKESIDSKKPKLLKVFQFHTVSNTIVPEEILTTTNYNIGGCQITKDKLYDTTKKLNYCDYFMVSIYLIIWIIY